MATKVDDKASDIPERLYDSTNNKTYKRMRFFGKVSNFIEIEVWTNATICEKNIVQKTAYRSFSICLCFLVL